MTLAGRSPAGKKVRGKARQTPARRPPVKPARKPPSRRAKTGASVRRESRRQKLAAGVLQGKTVTELARREGLSRTYASREVNSPDTRLLMAELLAGHRKLVAKLVGKALTRIGQAMDAHATEIVVAGQKNTKSKSGRTNTTKTYKSVLVGVDHYARMTAAKRLIEMVEAARSEDDRPQGQTITFEMFLTLLREAET